MKYLENKGLLFIACALIAGCIGLVVAAKMLGMVGVIIVAVLFGFLVPMLGIRPLTLAFFGLSLVAIATKFMSGSGWFICLIAVVATVLVFGKNKAFSNLA